MSKVNFTEVINKKESARYDNIEDAAKPVKEKGVPNKANKESKAKINEFVLKHMKEFEEAFLRMESPKDVCDIYIKLLGYVVPKMTSVDVNAIDDSAGDELSRMASEYELRKKKTAI